VTLHEGLERARRTLAGVGDAALVGDTCLALIDAARDPVSGLCPGATFE
jgi:hypothetical protein